jgi:hypothetical protein
MTINIAVATFDAIVLGCDSLSSIMQPTVPLSKAKPALAAEGNIVFDASGNQAFTLPEIEMQPSNVFGGVSKMFLLFQSKDTSVAAVTSGQGTINGRTISAWANMFKRDQELKKRTTRRSKSSRRTS